MNDERTELKVDVQQPMKDRQPWQRPILKRLQVNLDTALDVTATANDGIDGFASV